MYGRKYQWIIVGMYRDQWWEEREGEINKTCSHRELMEAMEGHFATDVLPLSSSENITVSGLVSITYFLFLFLNIWWDKIVNFTCNLNFPTGHVKN